MSIQKARQVFLLQFWQEFCSKKLVKTFFYIALQSLYRPLSIEQTVESPRFLSAFEHLCALFKVLKLFLSQFYNEGSIKNLNLRCNDWLTHFNEVIWIKSFGCLLICHWIGFWQTKTVFWCFLLPGLRQKHRDLNLRKSKHHKGCILTQKF